MNNIDVALLKIIPEVCPVFQARATARAITRYYNACLRPFGLTAEQFSLLMGSEVHPMKPLQNWPQGRG